ncbi:SDR family NAD(P)-dependent oxidoreductase [Brevibacillus laterosporus]|uniref:SDR family NAD(P)-dependent oxidoreductase n=1 Tax=Brevibacillus laterosporus TaxID=1465 RepID=A0AAP3DEC9_BRELA|nr:SDR family NAD(P)-dependent oxidoreductase [Brevibacillus laterosporus]MCR8978410.1 SDR family NAD(P)-dependent oxidoreductase [Brevibacillus laterosporus]MCZ0805565.1 SDR family NAD(P)-dependent oxidoreductase [Brevibacillus laterosporus]MCZ0825287.1 SDR family NAD(P)-dependent oxidoreductase [Brevibacillus laterosporus]MCZ0849063.1 SDR family NAD(P)-dependent oxidoreductase [Brevibacillus laterosporus]
MKEIDGRDLQIKRLDELLCKLLIVQLQKAGLFVKRSEFKKELHKKITLHSWYNKWLKESIRFCIQNQYVTDEGEQYVVQANFPTDSSEVWNEWNHQKEEWLKNPNVRSQVILVEATLRSLPDILTGKVLATDIMFPNSSMELVEGVYKHNDVADYFNDILADCVAVYVQERLEHDPSAKIRILEIGAGTGGTSARVLSKLKDVQTHIEEYCYTDISKAFLFHAEKEFGPLYSFLTYQLLNVEEPISDQGIRAGWYDLVIATNVLHATKNIRHTIRNTKALLQQNGLLLVNEMSSNNLFIHLTFGLLEGWWLYEDEALRIPGCPGLYPESWGALLIEEGFQSVFFPAETAHGIGQQIIVAESDGIVRYKRSAETSVSPSDHQDVMFSPERKKILPTTQAVGQAGIAPELLREKSIEELKKLVGETLKIPFHKIESSVALESYGIDSILVIQLTDRLRQICKSVTSTLFFEYPTIDALIDYFMATEREALISLSGLKMYQSEEESLILSQPLPQAVDAHLQLMSSDTKRFWQPEIKEKPAAKNQLSEMQDIAIIGLSGRYPGAENLEQYWQNLCSGKNSITEIPEDRWDWKEYYDSEKGKKGAIYTKWGGFIENIDTFDPLFFQISPKEAEQMDPQERLFLEVAYASIEDSGYTPEQLSDSGKVGVFVGVMNGNYPTGTSYWSIANRLSYLMNFKGPSLAVDTACSSSLTAIHLALESLYSGTSECVIAGGVNLVVDPVHYVRLSAMTMLSSTDQCKSFGDKADGFVDGEGVGAVVLKPLHKAIADGDHIYGVIKGSMLNAGGKTNGYTVPSPSAQSQLISDALKRSGVHPRMVSYLEAHGTGTTLGDPIEIEGLTRAFRTETTDNQFCAIGSVKSNIGHCESAAGIAGLTKILLQMKHGKIVPTLHAKNLNPNIHFEQTPFVVQQELCEWKRPVVEMNGEILECPRIAGISSFGAGGANAHVVIEEYTDNNTHSGCSFSGSMHNPALIVLSAKNEDRLREQARQLVAIIQARLFNDEDLINIAYTLQVGRQAMEARLAFTAASIGEVEEKLNSYLKGSIDSSDFYRGQAKRNKESLLALGVDEDMQGTIEAWIAKGKYGKLLEFWVNGLVMDWRKLYGEIKPHRISLPTYPFAKERYWIQAPKLIKSDSLAIDAAVHPLLHQNTSDLLEQRYSSFFTGEEFFFTDQLSNGKRILSPFALLELARAAVEQSTPLWLENKKGFSFRQMSWHSPIVANDSGVAQVNIGLFPADDAEITYDIYNGSQASDTDRILYGEGTAILRSVQAPLALDLSSIRRDFQRIEDFTGWLGIKEMYTRQGQVLAKVYVPESLNSSKDHFVIHPFLLEAVLQSAQHLYRNEDHPKNVTPSTLEELEVYSKCTQDMWAWLRYGDSELSDVDVKTVDIDLCDIDGTVCVSLRGLRLGISDEVSRKGLSEKQKATDSKPLLDEPYEIMTFQEVWREQPIAKQHEESMKTVVCFLSDSIRQRVLTEMAERMNSEAKLIFISQDAVYRKQAQQMYAINRNDRSHYEKAFVSMKKDFGSIDAILYLWPLEDESCRKDYASIVYLVQAMASSKLKAGRLLLAAAYKNEIERCHVESWIGFERSLGYVFMDTQMSVIIYEDGDATEQTLEQYRMETLWAELERYCCKNVQYTEGKRYVCDIHSTNPQVEKSMIEREQTYLITGGLGGLGMLFAEYLAKTYNVNLILTGRSHLDQAKQEKLDRLENLGSRVFYIQADICDIECMRKGLDQAKEFFGANIKGVIHAAGLESDRSILEKEMVSFYEVLGPKISGTITLDELLHQEELDFICYFSSTSAILGDFGSCDYAVGNRFQMAFADYWNRESQKGLRKGKAVVINWPFWKDGGMDIGGDESTVMYLKSSGQRALESEQGIALFERLLAQTNTQHVVLYGQPNRVQRFMKHVQGGNEASLTGQSIASGRGRRVEMKGFTIEQCLEWDLREQISQILKIPKDRIDKADNLADYGFDSISLTEFAKVLTKHFDIEMTPALFFGYSTLEKVIQYYLSEHLEHIQQFYREAAVSESVWKSIPTATPVITNSNREQAGKKREVRFTRFRENSAAANLPEPIAVIGMSGRFPQARNIEEMWRILADATDTVQYPPEYRRSLTEDRIDWKCGWVPGVDEFDPLFFEISPREAELMDPRQRLLLQETVKALEDAGYGEKQIKNGKVGMFVGVEEGDYQFVVKEAGTITSNHNAILASRISYFLNFNGPVLAINTACSSGLVAVHQACMSLRNNECETAIAAGVSLMLSPVFLQGMSQSGMLSKDSKCFAFDKRANGMVPGEAVTAVVLKRLSQAQADGDPIHAVIQGSGINYDGKTNGITAPSSVAQANLLQSVYDQYHVNPEDIEYIVTHGTGTKLGDPVEIHALQEAFNRFTKKEEFCALTSTKTNFGHTFAASGLVSFISLIQAFRHQTIPASLHFEQENEYIRWKNTPFYVNTENREWIVTNGKPLTGAVSAFGMSGTNVHMVLQNYSEKPTGYEEKKAPYHILTLSAKSEEALQEKIRDMIRFLEGEGDNTSLQQISYTLLEGRQHYHHRCAIVVQDVEDALNTWRMVADKKKAPHVFQGKVSREFIAQNAMERFVQELLEQSDLQHEQKNKYYETVLVLADLYCQGYHIDWDKLFGKDKPTRVHLPTYPFAREHYWGASVDSQSVNSSSTLDVLEPRTLPSPLRQENRLLQKHWEPCETVSSPGETSGNIVILTTNQTRELAMEISKQFSYSEILDVYDLDVILLQQNDWESYAGCIDLVGCGSEYMQSLVGISWLQQLIDKGNKKGLMLLGVTKGLEALRNDHIELSGACRAGLYRMLQSEYSHVRSRHVDLEDSDDIHLLAQYIATEFSTIGEESEICYRNGLRFKACHVEEEIESEKLDIIRSLDFPPEQVLWITGGTRGLGALCAQHLIAMHGVKKLVLTGREALPPREKWEDYLGQDTSIAKKLQMIRELESQGVWVKVLSVSLTDPEAVMSSLNEIKSSMGPIGGIIHCAGIGDRDYPAFIRKPLERIQAVLEPKVAGLQVLYECVKDEPLAFFVLFSSVSTAIPALASGQSDYAMANAYMDYFAWANRHECPITSIQWPSWKETGMGEVKSIAYQHSGLYSHTNVQGLQLLDFVLSNKLNAVVLPAMVDPELWKLEHTMLRKLQVPATNNASARALPLETGYVLGSVLEETQTWLLQLFSRELKIDQEKLETNIPIQDYGADSIILAQLMRSISQEVNEEIDPSILYEYATIDSLAGWLANTYSASLSKKFRSAWITKGALNQKLQAESLPVASTPLANVTDIGADIAVIGLSCRLPGANHLEEYWSLLAEGRKAIDYVPEERWGYQNHFVAGLLDTTPGIDPSFFHIPEEDAKAMDPQALLVLEESLKTLYHAGYPPHDARGKAIGVYLGARAQHWPDEERLRQARNPIVAVGQNYLAANISQFFDLRGPSLVVDTACSSALVGMNMGIQALLSGEIEAALVGGVSLLNGDFSHRLFEQRGILSQLPDFHVFDKRSNGVVLGEGAGMVLLKTVNQALKDGDRIYAVIKGIAINNDGRTAGPATPNVHAQKEVMQKALDKSGREAKDIEYIETNASGSEVTDLLELKAIQSVYRSNNTIPCALGSIKPNIGHPLSAEGIASFIKVVLMLQKRQFVPFLSGEQPMRHFDVENSPFYFHRKLTEWTGYTRIAGINCFGDGGTNAHVLVEAWEETEASRIKRSPITPPISRNGRDPSALSRTEGDETNKDASFADRSNVQTSSSVEKQNRSGNIWKINQDLNDHQSKNTFWKQH